jgi:hypothetical protein
MVRTEALAVRSGFHMMAAEPEQAIRMASQALTLVEGLDRPDLHARALDVIGASRVELGDERGIDDERHAIEIARESRALWELHAAMHNLGCSMVSLGRLREYEELLAERRAAFDELGGTSQSRTWFGQHQAVADYFAGRWDSALARVDEFLASLPEGGTHYLETSLRPVRALIELASDLVRQADTDVERAVGVASSSRDPQAIAPSLCARATLRLAEDRKMEAAADFEELRAMGERLLFAHDGLADFSAFGWLAVDLGRGVDARAVLDESPPGRWVDVTRAILAGDAAVAADLLAEIGHRPAEAYARLRAGGEHVERALTFYRSVGATRYVREAEALLAASG